MIIKECYVSSNGISCITNINTLHNLNYVGPYQVINNKLILYICIRTVEYIILDFCKNYKSLDFNNDNNILTSIIFS